MSCGGLPSSSVFRPWPLTFHCRRFSAWHGENGSTIMHPRQLTLMASVLAVAGLDMESAIDSLRNYFQARLRQNVLVPQPLFLTFWSKQQDTILCTHQHTVRYFSRPRVPLLGKEKTPGFHSHRATGTIWSLHNAPVCFTERRQMIVAALCINRQAHVPSFTLMMVDDSKDPYQGPDLKKYTVGWENRGFVVMGRNAAHHFLQSVLHVVYTDWFEEWSRSLDGLDEMVTTEVSEPELVYNCTSFQT